MNRENFAGRPSRPPPAPTSARQDLREFWASAPTRSRIALGGRSIEHRIAEMRDG